jgi:hypothetical protein
MLKNIGLFILLSLSSRAFSHEYEVVISDQVTGEVALEKCANEAELSDLKVLVRDLKDDAVRMSVKRMSKSVEVMAIKKGGGEGGVD